MSKIARVSTRREHPRNSASTVLLALLICASTLMTAATSSAASSPGPRSYIARTQSVTDTAYLHYTQESGADLLEEGQATGGLPGHVQVRFKVSATITATFTISSRNGSITGHGSGELHGTGIYASFGGTMTVTHGTGRYTHAHGHGGFYGTINRHTYASVVQTTGILRY